MNTKQLESILATAAEYHYQNGLVNQLLETINDQLLDSIQQRNVQPDMYNVHQLSQTPFFYMYPSFILFTFTIGPFSLILPI